MNRLLKAFAVYAVLGVLEWTTLSDEKIRIFGGAIEASPRKFALAILGVLMVLTLLHYWKDQMRAKLAERDSRNQ